MDSWWIDLLQVLLPMGLVVLMAYLLLKQTFQQFWRIKSAELQLERMRSSNDTKRMAYERLAVYLERMTFPDLITRVHQHEMEPYTLYSALLMTIQKEFEHNMAQQIYVSDQMWDIIRLARHELANLVTTAYHDLDEGDTDAYIQLLLQRYGAWNPHALEAAKRALRKEASLSI